MKRYIQKIQLLLTMLALGTLASCSSEEELTGNTTTTLAAGQIEVGSFPAFSENTGSRAIGTPDAGKTAWADGDKILLKAEVYPAFESNACTGDAITANTKTYTLTYNSATSSWTANEDIALSATDYRNGVKFTALYAPNYEWNTSNAPVLKTGKAAGTDEYLTTTSDYAYSALSSTTPSISFSAASRNYSRLRVAAAPDMTVTLTAADFAPAATSEALGTKTINTTADEKGNAYFYGSWAENAVLKITTNVDSQDWTLAEKTTTKAATQGNSYALYALNAFPETHTILLTKEGTLTDDLLNKAINSGNDLTLVGYMNDNDFNTMRNWFLNNMASHPLKNIDLSGIKGLTAIPDGAFAPLLLADVTTLESVKLPATVTKIGNSAFLGATQLKSINIGTVTDIGQYAFYNCSSLTGIDLSEVTAIGKWGFYECKSLGVIDAPKLEKLNEYVFWKCGTVSKIDLPSVTEASGAYTLASITVTEGGSINLPKCTKMGQSMFDNTRANSGTLYLTAAGTFTMNTMAFTNNLFIWSTKLVLNVDKKQGGSGSPLVTDNNKWGYQGSSTSLVKWDNISYVDNDGKTVE